MNLCRSWFPLVLISLLLGTSSISVSAEEENPKAIPKTFDLTSLKDAPIGGVPAHFDYQVSGIVTSGKLTCMKTCWVEMDSEARFGRSGEMDAYKRGQAHRETCDETTPHCCSASREPVEEMFAHEYCVADDVKLVAPVSGWVPSSFDKVGAKQVGCVRSQLEALVDFTNQEGTELKAMGAKVIEWNLYDNSSGHLPKEGERATSLAPSVVKGKFTTRFILDSKGKCTIAGRDALFQVIRAWQTSPERIVEENKRVEASKAQDDFEEIKKIVGERRY